MHYYLDSREIKASEQRDGMFCLYLVSFVYAEIVPTSVFHGWTMRAYLLSSD